MPSFDDQAAGFDRRAGIPEEAAREVARVVVELAAASPGDVILEIGAGTGEIGARLAEVPPRYLGLDLSRGMLEVFRGRLERAGITPRAARLVRADADRPWPVAESSVRALFLARAAHLLDQAHLIAETLRVAQPGGALFLLGAVRREPESVRAALRREMRRLLGEEGVRGRSRESAGRRLLDAFEERGGRALSTAVAAEWQVEERPLDALDAWRSKRGLAGREIDPALQRRVLDRLEAGARERWGDLSAPRKATDRYELAAVKLPPEDEHARSAIRRRR